MRKKTVCARKKTFKKMIQTPLFFLFPAHFAPFFPSFFFFTFLCHEQLLWWKRRRATTREEAVAGESRKLLFDFLFFAFSALVLSSFRPLLLTFLPFLTCLTFVSLNSTATAAAAATDSSRGRRRRLRRPLGDARSFFCSLLRQREEERERERKEKENLRARERASPAAAAAASAPFRCPPRGFSFSSLPPFSLFLMSQIYK